MVSAPAVLLVVGKRATAPKAITVGRDPGIASRQEAVNQRNTTKNRERPAPPEKPGEVEERCRATKHLPARGDHLHLREQGLAG